MMLRVAMAIWQLAQTLWVGSLWLLHFAIAPLLGQTSLASLLIADVMSVLTPFMMGAAALCVLVQMVVLVQLQCLSSLWRDARGQLLLAALLAVVVYGFLLGWQPQALRLQAFFYLAAAACGLGLVVRATPDGEFRARMARH